MTDDSDDLYAIAARIKANHKPGPVIDINAKPPPGAAPPEPYVAPKPVAPPPPRAVIVRPNMTPAEKLHENLSVALDRQAEIMGLGVDPDNLKQTRLVAEVSGATVNASLKAQENALQQKPSNPEL